MSSRFHVPIAGGTSLWLFFLMCPLTETELRGRFKRETLQQMIGETLRVPLGLD
jgi:hypothetical protein